MYQVTARNFSEATENKIHDDEVAQRYGFRGALVPGVAIWGHLTHPFVERDGVEWLGSAHVETRFHKPAYHGDRLHIEMTGKADDQQVTTCRNDDGEVLAVLRCPPAKDECRLEDSPRRHAFAAAPLKAPARVRMAWDTVEAGEHFSPWRVELDETENRRWCDEVQDELELYAGEAAAVHPHWLLGLANRALTREYEMPAWIHVGSEIRFHRPLRVGDVVTVHTLVEDKWQRKGHQFLRTYSAYRRGDEVTTEVSHTAIFQLAE